MMLSPDSYTLTPAVNGRWGLVLWCQQPSKFEIIHLHISANLNFGTNNDGGAGWNCICNARVFQYA